MGETRAAAGLGGRRQVLVLCVLLCWLCAAVSGQIQYSILEEMQRGAAVGNIAKDLGINARHLPDRKLRVVSDADNQYFALNAETGTLHVNDRIDREEMCGESPSCAVTFQAVVENPLNVIDVEVLVQDINDNAPRFKKDSVDLQIVESALPGTRIALENAHDTDTGINSLQRYELSHNQHFILEQKDSSDGYKSAELVLQNALDRETQSHYHLVLTAYDGGEPIKSSTVGININVLDANDNVPVFSQESYRASISEGVANNTVVLQVRATDIDEGTNSKITYSFSGIIDNVLSTFSLDEDNGEIKVKNLLDFEKKNSYKIAVEAKDGGGHISKSRVFIEVTDENDNAPEITLTSVTNPLPEDSEPGTVVAIINVRDRDSGNNGEVICHIQENLPFNLISSVNFYKLVTANPLDREAVPEYNIMVTATDKGASPLVSRRAIQIKLSDINDNPPCFETSSYQVFVPENNLQGISIYRLKALDLDLHQNSRIIYSILNANIDNMFQPTYISVNSQTGVIYAQLSYDYEKLKEFQFLVVAQDSGSPPLSSNVTVKVVIVDQNDNPPEILYPALGEDGSVMFEMIPLSSDPGYLITKVVAVDGDSGHNAWLSYHLIQVPALPLFKIGLHTGEIRTARTLVDKDLLNQKVAIMVNDNGQPPLSATVTLNMVFAESIHEAVPEVSDQTVSSDTQSNLEIYLVIALVLISSLFILTVMLLVVFKCRKLKDPIIFDSVSPAVYSQIDPNFTLNYQNGTLPLPFSYGVAVALGSGQRELSLLRPAQEESGDVLNPAKDPSLGNESLGGLIDTESMEQVRAN